MQSQGKEKLLLQSEHIQGLVLAGGGEKKGMDGIAVGIVGMEGIFAGRGGKISFGTAGMVGMLGRGGRVVGIVGIVGKFGMVGNGGNFGKFGGVVVVCKS
ncbi:hypothetical protein FEM48_ZijujUnG0026800 [Ziziphus jujuba var. spinosa]|uniref:Uncharacterized protein n=1 Tax=Ziziphus jujuba var. spinosa TaxID=714518 RepID=A0A978U9M8_ZIZJJ|nr:hypothetical protein FEM48_ZijujUnG0026800 [Ziziphus jujuba var. spinosa]